jgi:hypothetical protein
VCRLNLGIQIRAAFRVPVRRGASVTQKDCDISFVLLARQCAALSRQSGPARLCGRELLFELANLLPKPLHVGMFFCPRRHPSLLLRCRHYIRFRANQSPTGASSARESLRDVFGVKPQLHAFRWRAADMARGQRTRVGLPAPLVPLLREHRVRQLERRLAAGARWQEHGFVFTTGVGTPLDGPRVNATVKKLMTAAGVPALTFHSLRHSCASLLLVQGVAPRVVMEILGHSQISLTMNTYSHVIEQLQDEAAAQMTALLWADRKA